MRESRGVRLAALAAIVLASCPSSSPPPKSNPPPPPPPRADLVLTGGVVVAMTTPEKAATAVAIKDGSIAAVGSDADIKPWIGSDTKQIDLAGRTAVPGLVDSHLHLQGLGMRRYGIDLVGTNSVEEVRAKVKEAVKTAKKGEWLRGRGWDQNDWESYKKKGIKYPSTKDLDDLTPDNPIVLRRTDGHAIWVNKKALELAGINAKSKSKPGGEIVKDKKGAPSGIFIDNAMALIDEKVPALTKDQVKGAMPLAQKECLQSGLTQVHDMGIDRLTLEVLKELDDAGELKIRVYAMLDGDVEDLSALMGSGPYLPKDASKRLTVRGVKFFADGALGSRGALLLEPYADDKKTSGLAVTAPEMLEARMRSATDVGYQVATHAIGDKANRTVLDIYERIFGGRGKELRPRIEHAQIVHPDDIARFGKLGVIASMQPTHATSDMPWAEDRVGKKRLKGAYAWHSLLTTGATIAAGSDAPVEDVSPVLGLYAATTRKDLLGLPEGGWTPEEKMTPRQALYAFGAGGALASFREKEAGRIAPGFAADITVLDKNPLVASEDDLNAMQVSMTIVGGRVEFERAAPAATKTSTKS